VITQRNVHPGALVGPPASANEVPMVRIEQLAHLRLTVAVPEGLTGGIDEGALATFTVQAWPARRFTGTIRRIAHAVQLRTRTMPVEMDVENTAGDLAPGMYADVAWPVRRATPSLFVPASAIVQTAARTFVVRVRDGVVDLPTVRRGLSAGERVEVFGALQPGDTIAVRGREDLAPGTRVTVRPVR
jgi:RND family efflux transporter MFP subunit